MKKRKIATFSKAFLRLKAIMLIAVLISLGSGLMAQQAELKSEVTDEGKVVLKVENPDAYHWYLLFQVGGDGTYIHLEAQASDGSDIKFTTKYNEDIIYEVFEYASIPEFIPVQPDQSAKIPKTGLKKLIQ